MNAVTSIVYANEDPATFVDELQHILQEHYDELCVTKDFPLAPDYLAYGRLAVNGMLRCVTCRAEGNLIGYIIFIVQPHLHYMSCKTAFEDIYFLRKEFRQGRVLGLDCSSMPRTCSSKMVSTESSCTPKFIWTTLGCSSTLGTSIPTKSTQKY
jgi:hypothetical protein